MYKKRLWVGASRRKLLKRRMSRSLRRPAAVNGASTQVDEAAVRARPEGRTRAEGSDPEPGIRP
eukprot:14582034-Alexandrium_andersonii.AAC.1